MIRRAAPVVGTTVLVVLAAVMLAIAVAPRLGVRATVLTSGSMAPTFPAGGMVAVRDVAPSDVHEGQVLTYLGRGERGLVTHRVVGVHDVEGRRHFITQGDANPVRDAHSVGPERVVGVVVADLTPLSPLLTWAVGSRSRALLPGIAALWIAVAEVRDLRRRTRRSTADVGDVEPVATPTGEVTPPRRVATPVVVAEHPAPTTVPDLRPPPGRVTVVPLPGATTDGVLFTAAPRRARPRRTGGLLPRLAGVPVVAVVACAAASLIVAPRPSSAMLQDAVSVSASPITSGTVHPPSGVGATFACGIAGVGRKVTVTWTVGTAGTHDVERRTNGVGPWLPIGTTTAAQVEDTTIALGTTYEYRVTTTAGSWSSDPSPTASVTTPAVCLT